MNLDPVSGLSNNYRIPLGNGSTRNGTTSTDYSVRCRWVDLRKGFLQARSQQVHKTRAEDSAPPPFGFWGWLWASERTAFKAGGSNPPREKSRTYMISHLVDGTVGSRRQMLTRLKSRPQCPSVLQRMSTERELLQPWWRRPLPRC